MKSQGMTRLKAIRFRRIFFIIAVLLMFLGLIAGVLVFKAFQRAPLMAKESSQRALFVEAANLLSDYQEQSGKYPDEITGLPYSYPDGGSAELLKDFTYHSTGTSFTLSTILYSSGRTLEIRGPANSFGESLPPH